MELIHSHEIRKLLAPFRNCGHVRGPREGSQQGRVPICTASLASPPMGGDGLSHLNPRTRRTDAEFSRFRLARSFGTGLA